jgi:hypothetical protein
MQPTPKLRFVERIIQFQIEPMTNTTMGKPVRILQQWWEDKNIVLAVHITDKEGNTLPSPNHGEWRDVPLEKEE